MRWSAPVMMRMFMTYSRSCLLVAIHVLHDEGMHVVSVVDEAEEETHIRQMEALRAVANSKVRFFFCRWNDLKRAIFS